MTHLSCLVPSQHSSTQVLPKLTLKVPGNAHDSVVTEQECFEAGQLGKAF